MLVDLVKVETPDGVRLDGTLRRPASGPSRLGVDVVILHHGVGGNFYDQGMFEGYSDALLEQGCSVLRVNNRGHDPINRTVAQGETRRLGAAYEVLDDCRYDWEAWVDFAAAAGYKNIGIWGHSLGATKSIYYMGSQGDDRVMCVVAGSPPRFSYHIFAGLEEGPEFLDRASESQRQVDRGNPGALIETLYPFPLLVTAEVFMDKYGPDARYNILDHIPGVRVPLLVMIGTEEAQTLTSFKGLPPEIEKLAGEFDHLTYESIPGADHSYTHQRDYVWNVVCQWLKKV